MNPFTSEKVDRLKQLLDQSKHPIIVSHKSPDGDSVGSSLGLYHFLRDLGYEPKICHPDPAPDFLNWLEGAGEIHNWQQENAFSRELLAQADLIFCLDFNGPGRVGDDMRPALEATEAVKVMIDHHEYPELEFFDLSFSDVTCCSTSQLIAELVLAMNGTLTEQIGTPLYCGIMTDTGSFRFPSTAPRTHELVAQLMRAGVKHNQIHEQVYDTNTIDRLRLRGYAIAEKLEIWEDLHTAVISLTDEEMKRFNYKKGDTEGLVNVALSIVGVNRAAFFHESEGYVKISFRSKGDNNAVNTLAAAYFQGGGHKNAAGGRHDKPIESAIALFKQALQDEQK